MGVYRLYKGLTGGPDPPELTGILPLCSFGAMTPDQQRRVLAKVVGLIVERGYPPTRVELAQALGISRAQAHVYLNELVAAGLLDRVPRGARSLKVTSEGRDLLGLPA